MEKLQSVQQFTQLANSENVVFMFTAGWCPDCRVIDPIMPDIEKKFSDYSFVSVDRDEFIDLCIEKDIYGIPSFLDSGKAKSKGASSAATAKRRRKLNRLSPTCRNKRENGSPVCRMNRLFVKRRKLGMKSAELFTILKERVANDQLSWTLDRQKDIANVRHKQLGKGMTISLPQVINRFETKGDSAIEEIAYTISETFQAMERESAGELPGEQHIYPVIRSTSFPEESREGHRFLTSPHTAETRIYYALDAGTTYRLIDEKVLESLALTADQVQEIAKFQVKKLKTAVKEDHVAGNVFYFLNENDGYDATRILNETFLKDMKKKVQGDMTVSVPHQDVLIIGDIRNETGYDVLAQMAMHFFTNGKVPITSLSFVYENETLEPIFILAKNRPEKENDKK